MAGGKRTGNFIRITALHVTGEPSILFLINRLTFKNVITPSWNAEPAYGKMDDIPFYSNTKRNVQINFNTYVDEKLNYSAVEMQKNVGELIKFQYPRYSYAKRGAARVLSSPPFFRVEHFLQDINNSYYEYDPISGYIVGSLTIDPASEAGFSGGQPLPVLYNQPGAQPNEVFESGFSIGMNITVLHQDPPGWVRDEWVGNNKVFFSDNDVNNEDTIILDSTDPEQEVKSPAVVGTANTVVGTPSVGGDAGSTIVE